MIKIILALTLLVFFPFQLRAFPGKDCLSIEAPQAVSHFYKQFFLPGDLVFDVGANKGLKTLAYINCKARVVAFEPQPNCLVTLQALFSKNPSVIIESTALADRKGTMELHICTDAPTITTFSEEWMTKGRFAGGFAWDQTLNVPTDTLDAMILKYGKPVFCKIDVEGFELSVLKGLSQPISYLSFEFSSEILSKAKECINHLTSIGFTHFNVAFGEEPRLMLDTWKTAEELIYFLEHQTDQTLWGDIYAHARNCR